MIYYICYLWKSRYFDFSWNRYVEGYKKDEIKKLKCVIIYIKIVVRCLKKLIKLSKLIGLFC